MLEISARLFAAMIAVESGGNDIALGPRGEMGCLQVTPSVLGDVRRFAPDLGLDRSACFSRYGAMMICRIYLRHYATPDRLGREPTDEDLARIWNGGPCGWENPLTKPYWRRVKEQMAVLALCPNTDPAATQATEP